MVVAKPYEHVLEFDAEVIVGQRPFHAAAQRAGGDGV